MSCPATVHNLLTALSLALAETSKHDGKDTNKHVLLHVRARTKETMSGHACILQHAHASQWAAASAVQPLLGNCR
jgi:hypothetical protein